MQLGSAFAGLEGADNTAWQDLTASERTALACVFINEADSSLALKFLARVMASFGGANGIHTHTHTHNSLRKKLSGVTQCSSAMMLPDILEGIVRAASSATCMV